MLECWEYTYIYVCVWKLTYNESMNTVWKPDFLDEKRPIHVSNKTTKAYIFWKEEEEKAK